MDDMGSENPRPRSKLPDASFVLVVRICTTIRGCWTTDHDQRVNVSTAVRPVLQKEVTSKLKEQTCRSGIEGRGS